MLRICYDYDYASKMSESFLSCKLIGEKDQDLKSTENI